MTTSLSLVIPLHNEVENVGPVVASAVEALTSTGRSFEVILVDDGSDDGTPAELSKAALRWAECRVVTLPARAGQASALLHGLGEARGSLIITMDGDGQNDPADIPAMIELAESGPYDLVCGWRVARRDPALRRVMSAVANLVRRAVLADQVHDAGCQLRVMRPSVVRVLMPFEMLQAFIPAIAAAAGLRIAETPVRHHARARGLSKYGLGRLWWRPALAMLRLRRTLSGRAGR